MKNYRDSHFKKKLWQIICWQGLFDKPTAIDIIRQGRIRVNNRLYFDPNHGIWVKPGSQIRVDNICFNFYPRLYIIYHKAHNQSLKSVFNNQRDIEQNENENERIFPAYFHKRSKGDSFQALFGLPTKMSGLVVCSDDELLFEHERQAQEEKAFLHTFDVYFMHTHKLNDDQSQSQYQNTDWNKLTDETLVEQLMSGVHIKHRKHSTQRKYLQTVNLESIQLLDDNINHHELLFMDMDNTHFRVSKWEIKTRNHSLFERLLRSMDLYPYFIHRTCINSLCLNSNSNNNHPQLNSNEWRTMQTSEITAIANYNRKKFTEITQTEVITSLNCSQL